MENGVELDFSAPPSLHGVAGVLTPEDAFMAAVNTCYHMMFIWACERFKVDLVSYSCEAIGKVVEFIDKTSVFSEVLLKPKVVVRNTIKEKVENLLKSARKFSLIAESIKAEFRVEPEIQIVLHP
jgi:organic hydroperoxide reductase OsmC/OhrA